MDAISLSWRNPTIDVPPESAAVDGTPSLTSLRLPRRELANSFSNFIRPRSLPRRSGIECEVTFDGTRLGIFTGSLRYTFYPGIPLIQQAALVSTHEPDTAFYYDAGLEMTAEQDRRIGGSMESHISYYDVEGNSRNYAPLRFRPSLAYSARSHGGGEDGRGEHCGLSTSAPLFLCARLHDQSGIPLV